MAWLVVLVVLAAGAYALRNRVLDWQRPALAARASAAAGRPVTLSRVELDAACRRLTLAGSVELAPGVRLAIDRAVLTGVRELAELDGSLTVDDPRGTLTAPVSLRGQPAPGQLWAGQVSVRDALVTHRASGQELLASLTARAAVDARAWSLGDLRLTAQGAALTGALGGTLADPAGSASGELKLEGAGPELVTQAFRLADPAAAPRLPGDLVAGAVVTLAPGLAATATGELATAASKLSWRLQCDPARILSDTRCGGRVGRADLAALGLVDGVPLAGEPELSVNAKVDGSLFDPSLTIELFCPSLQLRLPLNPVLENLTAQVARAPGRAPGLVEASAQVTVAGARGTAAARAVVRPASGGYAVQLHDGRLTPRRAVRRPLAGFAGSASVTPGPVWAARDLKVQWGDLTLAGAVAAGPQGQLELDGLDADGLADLVLHLGGPALRVMHPQAPPGGIAVPADLRASARVTLSAGQPPGLNVALGTASSQVWLTGALDERAPVGFKLAGRLSTRDINAMEWFAPAGLDADGECFLDLVVERPLALRLAGPVRAPRLEVRTFRGQPTPKLELADVAAVVGVSAEELTWTDVKGTFLAGTLSCAGRLDLTADPFPYTCRIDAERLNVSERLRPHVEGRLSGHVKLEGRGADLAQLTGEGALTLADARYPFLKKLEPTLATYGLPVPPLKATAPAHTLLAIGRETVRLRGLDVRVDGAAVHGEAAIGFDGQLGGRLELDLEPSYLKQSNLLLLPAAVSKAVRIPATLAGTVFDPRITADLQAAFGNWMKSYSFGDVASGIAKSYEFGSLTKGLLDTIDRLRPGQRLQPGPELDRVFEKILSGAPGSQDLMDQLEKSGVTQHQLESWLADYRRRRDRR